MSLVPRLDGLRHLAHEYDAIFCDVWGVIHNGVSPWQAACDGLAKFRDKGGTVVMITNSPKPSEPVIAQMKQIGVNEAGVYDAVVSSGDATRSLISQVKGGICFLGPQRDLLLFDGLDVEFCDLENADAVVCTGMRDDEKETPEMYHPLLQKFLDHRLPFICANPDIVVDRGDRQIWCAGALARDYKAIGGEVRIVGKPHQPIYDQAMAKLGDLVGENPDKSRILAIGDGMPTDVKGALEYGLDLLYVSAGIHASEYGDPDNPQHSQVQEFLTKHNAKPTAYMPRLIW